MNSAKPRSSFPLRPTAPPTAAAQPKPDNALWRIPTWFPDLPGSILEQLKVYHGELLKFNARLNLVSKTTERESDEIHFADCLYSAQMIEKSKLKGSIYDIGSGNGLPGLVMALLSPDRKFFLVESDARKCEFIKHMVGVLKLGNCTVMNVRIESLKGEDIQNAVSRGFASISKTILMMNKILPMGARFFHMKGTNWSTEIAEIPSQLISVWTPELVGEYSLPATQVRRAIVSTTKISK